MAILKKFFIISMALLFILPVMAGAQSVSPTTFYLDGGNQGALSGFIENETTAYVYNTSGDYLGISNTAIQQNFLIGDSDCVAVDNCFFTLSELGIGSFIVAYTSSSISPACEIDLISCELDISYLSQQSITILNTAPAPGYSPVILGVATSTGSQLLAQVSAFVSEPGILNIIILIAGILLVFSLVKIFKKPEKK